jgi:hypothetical protein
MTIGFCRKIGGKTGITDPPVTRANPQSPWPVRPHVRAHVGFVQPAKHGQSFPPPYQYLMSLLNMYRRELAA